MYVTHGVDVARSEQKDYAVTINVCYNVHCITAHTSGGLVVKANEAMAQGTNL